jgi:hypothetical protein
MEGVGESSSIITNNNKKANGQSAFKKPRLETPSPLPTFKVHIHILLLAYPNKLSAVNSNLTRFSWTSLVIIWCWMDLSFNKVAHVCNIFQVRKEKLGDRVTALQQLVAPFGKVTEAFDD